MPHLQTTRPLRTPEKGDDMWCTAPIIPLGADVQKDSFVCPGQSFYQKNSSIYQSYFCEHLFLVPPSILNPTSDIDNTPIYNQEYSLTCEVTGKAEVDVTWLKDDGHVTGFKPQIDTEISISDGPYDVTTGVQSTLPWNPQGSEATCETATTYNGNYRCVAKNTGPDGGERDKMSAVIKLTTKCE